MYNWTFPNSDFDLSCRIGQTNRILLIYMHMELIRLNPVIITCEL